MLPALFFLRGKTMKTRILYRFRGRSWQQIAMYAVVAVVCLAMLVKLFLIVVAALESIQYLLVALAVLWFLSRSKRGKGRRH